MRLRQILVDAALATGAAAAIFGGLPAVANADGAGMEGFAVVACLVPVVVIILLVVGLVCLLRIQREPRKDDEDPPAWRKNQDDWWGRPR